MKNSLIVYKIDRQLRCERKHETAFIYKSKSGEELISAPVASRCEIPQFSLQVQLCLKA
jgi:hypothetical protein